jgi:magnesium-transporting ATPase (P-type)
MMTDQESLQQMIELIIRWWTVLMIVSMVLSLLLTLVLQVWPFWRIFRKAGFQGALSLLMLVPIVSIFVPFYLAFAEWPALKNPPKQG